MSIGFESIGYEPIGFHIGFKSCGFEILRTGEWKFEIGGWELVVGGSGGQSLVGWWLGVGLVAVIGHWRFSRLMVGCPVRHGSVSGDWTIC